MKMIVSKAKPLQLLEKGRTRLIKEAHKLSIKMREHVFVLIYSRSGTPYFYDFSNNVNAIYMFSNQDLQLNGDRSLI